MCLLLFTGLASAELNQQINATYGANLNATTWNGEFANIYDNPNDYAEDMSIAAATIVTITGNFTGTTVAATGTITGDITSSTLTPANEPTSCTGITFLPNWTAIDVTDSPYTVTIGDYLLVDTTAGEVRLNTPTPTKDGDSFVVCDSHEYFNTNNLVIDPGGYYTTVSSGTTGTISIKYPLSAMFTYFNADGGEPGWLPVGFGYTTKFVDER